ncbi:hypothetical protein V6N12_020985 [Hibiscus sabdariffa]|uniref:Uncharacterized protein n=1 Tax=Hibiscus sabdariffa TaxID=183260 RepID=A0ABR2D0D7_9ROSI
MANPNPNEFPPFLPVSIPPSNSTSVPPDGGLCPDVVPHVVLERPASPLGGDLRAFKKVRGIPVEIVDDVVSMDEGNEARQQSPNEAVDGGIGLKRASYATAVSGASEKSAAGARRNAVESELDRPKVSGPSDDVVFGPWMIADTRRRRPRKDIRPAVGLVTAPNGAQGSRFTVLENDVEIQGDRVEAPQPKNHGSSSNSGSAQPNGLGRAKPVGVRYGAVRGDQLGSSAMEGPIIRDVTSEAGQSPLVSHVAVNNVSGSHSALVIHDGKQLKHGGGGALRVAGSSKKGLKVSRGKDIRISTLSTLSDYVQSIGKVPGVRGDEGQLSPSIRPILIPDDRPFEPGDKRSNSISGCLEDDMEGIVEEVEALSQ